MEDKMKRGEKEWEAGNYEKIITQVFPKLLKDSSAQIQKAQHS